MVRPVKPVITIIENQEYTLLILGTTLLIFISIILYFSKYYYNRKFSVKKQEGNNPMISAGGLDQCTKGQCVIDIETGLKQCPQNPNIVMYYDDETQQCVEQNSCISNLPYAMKSDGSVDEYGNCCPPNNTNCTNKGCRCTSNVTCPVYNSSKFSIVNGSLFSIYGSGENYIFEQIPINVTSNPSVSDDTVDTSKEYCKINSTYSSSLVGGCSFTNQVGDFLMKCDKEELSDISVSPYSLDPYYLDTSGVENKQFCEVIPYLDSNFNNMTLCVNHNPCKYGNYTYNFDIYRNNKNTSSTVNSRDFCQSYASDLNTYTTDLNYYTLSCIGGTKCNQVPNQKDIQKFYSSQNQELDLSAINASYPVSLLGDFIVLSGGEKYNNPLLNTVKSGDLLKIATSSPTDQGNIYYKMIFLIDKTIFISDITTEEEYNFVKLSSIASQQPDITYYPQFAMNGFGYNTNILKFKKYYRTSNCTNTPPVTQQIGNVFMPLPNIILYQTFYRSGLSKPQGYVFKQAINEEEVEADIENNNAGFNANNYQIKQTKFSTEYYNDISFYSPVWNNQYGRSECIRCSPLLIASINMRQSSTQGAVNGYEYDAATIQFSGKDFGHYRYNFSSTISQNMWLFESIAYPNKAKVSTPSRIVLERPNVNINVGDYILSSGSEFNYTIKQVGTNIFTSLINQQCIIMCGDCYMDSDKKLQNVTPFYYESSESFVGIGTDTNIYQDFKKNVYIESVYNSDGTFKVNEPSEIGSFLFGNKYVAIFDKNSSDLNYTFNPDSDDETLNMIQVEIVPSVKVTSILDSSIIQTDYKSSSIFNKSSLNVNSKLQFISPTRFLSLNNNSKDVNTEANSDGSGGKISVDEITDGRITSIKVYPSGTNYTNVSPMVKFDNYDHYFF